jgi:lysophospholipid acyltransferase (LPLAT)-like uncharacterized protein
MRREADKVTQRLEAIARLSAQSGSPKPHTAKERGRNWWTRAVDAVLVAVRHYAPLLHRLGSAALAICLCIYAHLCALTIRLTTSGVIHWPHLPSGCVLAIWHGCAPSLIVAIAAQRPRTPLAILITSDPRGDSLSLLCRMLDLRVVRVTAEGGWAALSKLASEIEQGACAIITADGLGPARVAKVGAVALSSATAVPILTAGADCHPAIPMPHKWDAARIPLPLGRVRMAFSEARHCPDFTDSTSIENARLWLEQALNEAAAMATRAF